MPIAPIGTGNGDGDTGGGNADDLADVTLGHFTAAPSAIGPFDFSVLSWHVNGVKPRVRVVLDATQVAASGQAIVQPAVTAGYTLSATSGNARKTLGHVTVSVDRATCEEVALPNLLELLRQQIIIGVNAQIPANYWAGNVDDPNILSVALSHDELPRIVIRAVVRQRIPWFPDAWVTLDLSFGLGINNGAFVAVVPQSQGTVEFDAITSAVGGVTLALALAVNNANEQATAVGYSMINGLLTYINTVELHPIPGKQARSAIAEYRNGKPFFGYIACGLGREGTTIVLAGSSQVIAMPT